MLRNPLRTSYLSLRLVLIIPVRDSYLESARCLDTKQITSEWPVRTKPPTPRWQSFRHPDFPEVGDFLQYSPEDQSPSKSSRHEAGDSQSAGPICRAWPSQRFFLVRVGFRGEVTGAGQFLAKLRDCANICISVPYASHCRRRLPTSRSYWLKQRKGLSVDNRLQELSRAILLSVSSCIRPKPQRNLRFSD
jgi:hypothetical protein